MEPVKWGIISTANIGMGKVNPAMMKGELCQLAAIASRDAAKAREAADTLGIEKSYGSYEEMLADPEIEAVYNPLPNHLHVPLTIQAADAGKHVLCEKPIALTAGEARTLIEVRDRNKVLIQEAFMTRTHPQWVKARELAGDGSIGEVRAINGIFSYYNVDPDNVRNMADIGGGALYDIGCYPITMSRFVYDEEPRRVLGLVERDPTFGTDRLVSAILDYPSGQAAFTVSTQLVPYQRMHILGTRGRVEVEIPFNAPPDAPTRLFVDDGSELADASASEITFDVVDQYTIQGDEFSRAIRTGAPQPVSLENSIANMQVIDAVFKSAETGGWVTL